MTDRQMAGALELHWVSVPDPDGGTHLESHWAPAPAQPHAQAA